MACKATGGELQCGGLWPLCEGLECGGSSIEEGVEQPAREPSGFYLVVMEWMATITGDHVCYPGFWGFGGFFSEEKKFGEPSSPWRKRKLSSMNIFDVKI